MLIGCCFYIHVDVQVTYEAKVIEISNEGMLRVHYTGWNTRYDEWIKPQRIARNVTQQDRTRSAKVRGHSFTRSCEQIS